MKRAGWAVAAIGVAAVAGIAVLSAASSESSLDWSCKDQMVIHGDAVSGYPDVASARSGALTLLANVAPGFKVSPTEASSALSASTGPDRYDASTGKLFVNDVLVAQFTVTKMPDGSYLPGDITTCAPTTGGQATPAA